MELNREQIIKAFECCHTLSSDCLSCPFLEDSKACASVSLSALALIRELTEENERLRIERNDAVTNFVLERSALISYLRGLIKKSGEGLYNYPVITHEFLNNLEKEWLGGHKDPIGEIGECGMKHKCVAEIVRKMQERLKNYLREVADGDIGYGWIDQIAKEVLEERA